MAVDGPRASGVVTVECPLLAGVYHGFGDNCVFGVSRV